MVTVGSGGGAAGAGGIGGSAVGGNSGTGGDGDGGNVGGSGAPVDSSQPDDGGGPSDAPPSDTNRCADGTREAFTDEAHFPSIAGLRRRLVSARACSPTASMALGCARAAGNDGSNRAGTNCTVEDLCADGWHVCRGASELTLHVESPVATRGIGPAAGGGSAMFFATRQRGTPPTGCSPDATTGSNNLHGCGNFGRAEDPVARPARSSDRKHVCAANPPWSCTDPASIMTEAMVTTKSGFAAGGVLCCR